MEHTIKNLKAREILDSRGDPTVQIELITDSGSFLASVPSGTSKGKYEALELRDDGRGVDAATRNVDEVIFPKLKGEDVKNQRKVDQMLIDLDGTKNKSKLGVNAILPTSMAVCRAGAAAGNLPLWQYISQIYSFNVQRSTFRLPTPCILLIEGGLHAVNELSVQEFMILPKGDSFKEKLEIGIKIYHTLGLILEKEYGKSAVNLGQEGAFTAPSLKNTKEPIDFILKATEEAGYNGKAEIVLDVAAPSFFKEGMYQFEGRNIQGEELINFYQKLCKEYPIFSIEDPFSEDDWESWSQLNSKIQGILIVGDDLLATNPERMKEAKEKNACNAAIIKPNQIGTVTEAVEAAKLSQSFDWKIMASHRAGETTDDFISDLAVGISADFIKSGSPSKKERMTKYNRLLRIEEEIRSGM